MIFGLSSPPTFVNALFRYPLHFHMSECVHGSTLAKNVIYKSNQRCIVVHGSHNVTVADNVAYDTNGHCFMLEGEPIG